MSHNDNCQVLKRPLKQCGMKLNHVAKQTPPGVCSAQSWKLPPAPEIGGKAHPGNPAHSSQGLCVLPAPVCPLHDLRQPQTLYLPSVTRTAFTGPCLYSPPCSGQQATSGTGQTSVTALCPAVQHWKGAGSSQTHKGLTFASNLIAIFSRNLLKLQIKFHSNGFLCQNGRWEGKKKIKSFFIKKGNICPRLYICFPNHLQNRKFIKSDPFTQRSQFQQNFLMKTLSWKHLWPTCILCYS